MPQAKIVNEQEAKRLLATGVRVITIFLIKPLDLQKML